jgi:hypothetical protein
MFNRYFTGALVAVAMIGALPLAAQAFSTKKNMQVNTMNTEVFEVVSSGAAKGYEYWCAVGDYAQRGRGLPWKANIYVARGLGQSETTEKRSAVQFTFDPQAAGVTASASYRSTSDLFVGDNMSVQQAVSQCQTLSGRY